MNQHENKITGLTQGAIRRGWQASVLLLAGLITTALVALHTKSEVDVAAKREFDFVCNEIKTKILDRLSAHEQILRSGAAFYEDDDGVSREEWRRFTERQKVEQHLPGIQGIGFALLIPPQNLAQHVQEIRAQGFPDYHVWPDGKRESYSSVIYLEPFTNRNLRAFGYDMFSEPVRRAAMERARDQDAAALSEKIVLVQETEKNVQAGTLMYVPVYRFGMPHDTIVQRRNAILGWVYSPYRMNDLMHGILGGWDLTDQKQIRLEVFDGEMVSADTLLYDSQPGETQRMGTLKSVGVHGDSVSGNRQTGGLPHESRLTSQSKVVSNGRPWTLRFTRTGSLSAMTDYGKVWLVVFGGTSVSLLISGLFFVLNTRTKALQMARELSTKLAQSEQSYRNQFASNSAVMLLVDPTDGTILEVNAAAVSFYGYSRERLLTMRISDINTKPLAEALQIVTSTLSEQGHRFQFQHRLANGALRDVEVSISYIQFGGRSVFHSIVFDVTDRKLMLEAIQESEIRHRSIFTVMAEGVVLQAADGTITDCNLYAEKLLGLTRDEIKGLTSVDPRWRAVNPDGSPFPGEDHPAMVSLRTGRACHDVLLGIQLPDGSRRWLNINSEPMVRKGETQPYAVVSSFSDITERMQSEVALRESEMQFRSLFETMTEGVAIHELVRDPEEHAVDYRILDVNPAYERQTGITAAQAKGQLASQIYGTTPAPYLDVYEQATRTRVGCSFETYFPQLQRHFEISVCIPKPGFFATVFMDITQRKQSEAALRESESRLRLSVQAANIGLWDWDLVTNTVYYSPQWKSQIGYRDDEIANRLDEWQCRTHPDDLEPKLKKIRACIENPQGQYDIEFRLRHKDGSYRWINALADVLRDADGKPVRMLGCHLDITERKKADEALRQSEAKLRTALASMTDAVFISDVQGQFIDFNDAFATFHRFKTREQCAKRLAEYPDILDVFMPSGELAPLEQWAVPRALRGETVTNAEYILRRKDTNETWVGSYSFAPIRDKNGTIVGSVVVGRDITERKQAEDSIRELNRTLERRVQERTAELRAANEELESFSYSVSHDLRAPLRHVHGYVEMLAMEADGHLSEKGRHYLKTIAEASEEMGVLIDNLLAFSRMGRTEMREASVDLDVLVRETLRDMDPTTSNRNIVWKIPPLPAAQGDSAMLKQVLANLLGNAVKYTGPRNPAEIEIGCEGEENGRAIFFVRDNGVGFDPQYTHKLFGVFQRLHRADEFEGTGIGLANVRRIIARHGGRTWAEGAEGKGATFYFTLKVTSTLAQTQRNESQL